MKYRRKEIVDAIQFNEENPQVEVKQMLYFSEIIVDLTGNGKHSSKVENGSYVDTYENGWSRINNGDYVVTDIEGHVSIIDKKLFESLYEPLYPLSN
jgi:hypothetical protein